MKKIKTKLELMNIMDEIFHHIVPCKINGKNGRLLVDTGASKTVFDVERLKKFNHKGKTPMAMSPSAGAGGILNGMQIIILKNMNILKKINAKNYLVALTDLSHINHLFTSLKGEAIDGVLGNDFLINYGATIDFAKNSVEFNFDEKKMNKKHLENMMKIKKVMAI